MSYDSCRVKSAHFSREIHKCTPQFLFFSLGLVHFSSVKPSARSAGYSVNGRYLQRDEETWHELQPAVSNPGEPFRKQGREIYSTTWCQYMLTRKTRQNFCFLALGKGNLPTFLSAPCTWILLMVWTDGRSGTTPIRTILQFPLQKRLLLHNRVVLF